MWSDLSNSIDRFCASSARGLLGAERQGIEVDIEEQARFIVAQSGLTS
jgi:hypothetical protein